MRTLTVIAVLAMASCGAADAPTAPGAPAAQQGIPAQPPSIRGAVTVVHDGPYGGLVGKSVALEPATGFSFDSPIGNRLR